MNYAPYASSDSRVVRRMLEIARVSADDLVYDLGCGDARILVAAVKDFKARGAVGYEIDENVYATALSEIEKSNLQDRIKVVHGDLFNADISKATVITLYLTAPANERLKGKLEKEARSGTRIVSHDFEVPEWKPSFREEFGTHAIYLYRIPVTLNKRRKMPEQISKRELKSELKKFLMGEWSPTRDYIRMLDEQYHFLKIQRPPSRFIDQKTLVSSDQPRNPKGFFTTVRIYYIAHVSNAYSLLARSIRYSQEPKPFREICDWIRGNALTILEESVPPNYVVIRPVAYTFSTTSKKPKAIRYNNKMEGVQRRSQRPREGYERLKENR